MGLFTKNPLKSMKLENLREEKVNLERREKVLHAEIKDLSAKKKRMFSKGFDKKITDAEKRSLVRQMQTLDRSVRQKEIQHKGVSDSISAIDGMVFIKENERAFKNTPFMGKVQKISGTKLQDFLSKASVKEAIKSGKIDQLNKIFDIEYGMGMDAIEDDDSVKELMDIWSTGETADIEDSYDKWVENTAKDIEETV